MRMIKQFCVDKEQRRYAIFRYDFETVSQFLRQCQCAPFNEQVFDSKNPASHITSNSGWSGTGTYEEAVELCQKGWSEGFENFVHLKKRIDEEILSPIIRFRQVADVVGYAPSVPDWLNGNPFSMWNTARERRPAFVNIYFNIDYNMWTDAAQILNRGAIVMSIVDALENSGYNVRLETFSASYCGNEALFVTFNLKGEGEKLNLRKVYFPLCHPAFLRRLCFRLQETTPLRESRWGKSYGHPVDCQVLKSLIEPRPNNLLIGPPREIGVRGKDLYEDLEAVLRLTNLRDVLAKV